MDNARAAADIEHRLLAVLRNAWRGLNHAPFGRTLREPTFRLMDHSERHGAWLGHERIIEISRASIRDLPWGAILEVLRHEMAHQYVDEVLGGRDPAAHGPLFRRVARQFGVTASATRRPEDMQRLAEDPVLRKVRKLLALAGSPNAAEAESAMQAARRLMARHGLAADEPAEDMAVAWVGPITGRTPTWRSILGGILARHFAVSGIYIQCWNAATGRAGTQLEITGRPPDVEMATWVYVFLEQTGERLWRDHRRVAGISGDRDRQRYLSGVMLGFSDKMKSQDSSLRQEGLVLTVGAQAREFFERRYPQIRHRSGGWLTHDKALHDGRAAGREIVLSRPVGGHAGNQGGRLPSGSGRG